MTVAHWARHGEDVANTSHAFPYRVFDGGLTDRGIAQAGQLAGVLRAAGHRHGLLVCSPLRRARWQACETTLASWRSGELSQRFPGGSPERS
jgi:broad specificity phosphatase PhoE